MHLPFVIRSNQSKEGIPTMLKNVKVLNKILICLQIRLVFLEIK